MDELFERIKKIIAEKLEVEEDKITLEASFRQDLGADSLDTYELVYGIEEEMGINIPIPVWNLPCVALLSYAVLRGGFIGVAPAAVNKGRWATAVPTTPTCPPRRTVRRRACRCTASLTRAYMPAHLA